MRILLALISHKMVFLSLCGLSERNPERKSTALGDDALLCGSECVRVRVRV